MSTSDLASKSFLQAACFIIGERFWGDHPRCRIPPRLQLAQIARLRVQALAAAGTHRAVNIGAILAQSLVFPLLKRTGPPAEWEIGGHVGGRDAGAGNGRARIINYRSNNASTNVTPR